MFGKTWTFIVGICVVIGLLAISCGVAVGAYFYIRMTRDLPQIERLSDYRPKAVSYMYASDGTLIAELSESGERRYPITNINDIPILVRNAFLAAEDANFYTHPGIDITSILRAIWVNLRSQRTRQGASTITQQVVKSLLLSRERTYERKVKEAVLSYRLEKSLSKDEIFLIYLNEIFLGNGAYGIRAAAKTHFHKELPELTVAEAAFLAGLPQRPSKLTEAENRKQAFERKDYVVTQMLKNKMISEAQYEEAKKQQIEIFPQVEQNIYAAPYYVGHAMKVARELMHSVDPGISPEDPGGYHIQTTVDLKAYRLAESALRKSLRELDKRQGWRGPLNRRNAKGPAIDQSTLNKELKSRSDIKPGELYPALISKINSATGLAEIRIGEVSGSVNVKDASWAKAFKKGDSVSIVNPEKYLKVGDIIEVMLKEDLEKRDSKQEPEKDKSAAGAEVKLQQANLVESAENKVEPELVFKLDQTPEVEGAMTVHSALTGEVKAIIGGYDYAKSSFNRATQGLLQPGSAFKPIVYLGAVEQLKYTPSTIVPDSPISLPAGNGTMWSPQNYDHEYLGPITLRVALERSRNVVSVHLVNRLGVDRVVETAKRLGLTTDIPRNLSIALGTPEIHVIELARAYGAFAAEGWLAETLVVKSIKDRDGKVIYQKKPKQKKVISDEDAFIMANMMRGVVENGTAQILKKIGRPIAGKTGTTNDQMDAWFVGFTPEWVLAVWVGNDVKKSLGKLETGGKAAAPAVLYFLEEFLKDSPDIDFNIPNGVVPVRVNHLSGHLAGSGEEDSILEYFKSGTEPNLGRQEIEVPQDYLSSDEF